MESFSCGTLPRSSISRNLSPTIGLFDSEVIRGSGSNCSRVWIKVNIHFFLDDNCNGSIYPLPNIPYDMDRAYERAEQLINECNEQLANDTKVQWAQVERWNFGSNPGQEPIQGVQCNPIRYALSGVYIHCSTTAEGISGSNVGWFRDNFGVNVNSEYNVFMIEWIGSSTGQADGIPGKAFTAENFSISVFNHEMGHVLDLRHTFSSLESLTDTPDIEFEIDYNCDGDNNDSWTNGGITISESQRFDSRIWCKPSDCPNNLPYQPLDYDLDGIINYQDPCNPQIEELEPNSSLEGCLPQPWCNDEFHSNNIMNYSQYTQTDGVFTSQQIDVMVNHLNVDANSYIEAVLADDQCPPPMANIHIFPNEDVDDCAFCFQLEATMHDNEYRIEFLTLSGAVQYDTGWKTGPAIEQCISRSIKYINEYKHGFQPNTAYIARMTVENVCGDQAVEDRMFTLPPLSGCQEPIPKITIKSLYPNPFTNNLNYEYTVERQGHLKTWLVPSTNGSSEILLNSEQVIAEGTYIRTVTPPSNITSGVYYLVLDLDGEVVGSILIKL